MANTLSDIVRDFCIKHFIPLDPKDLTDNLSKDLCIDIADFLKNQLF